MKRLFGLITFIALLGVATPLSAQYTPAGGGGSADIRFGFQLSPSFGWMSTNETLINSNGTNLGLKLGMIAEFYFRENYAFTTGLGFHFNAGGTLYYEGSFDEVNIWTEVEDLDARAFPGETDFKYSLQFVEIPFGLKLRTREFGYLRYYMQPALHLGITTQSRGQIENVTGVDSDEKYDIGSAVNPINLGWGFGAGVEYNVSSSTSLIGGLAFQSGFADLTKDKNTRLVRPGRMDKEDDSKGKINSITLVLGVMF